MDTVTGARDLAAFFLFVHDGCVGEFQAFGTHRRGGVKHFKAE